MEFLEMVDYFKEMREGHQTLPVPVPFPAQLIGFDGETIVFHVASKPTSQHMAAMFSAIAVCKADRAVFGMDTLVRAATKHTEQPLGADPDAKTALLVIEGIKPDDTEIAIEAFSVDDAGKLNWIWGSWYSPLAGRLAGAIHQVFAAEVPNSVMEYVLWMQLNGYAIKIHPSLYNPE